MESSHPPTPTNEPSDIFSLSDQVLADKLEFVEEIGFGNWGSVWLCRPKASAKSETSRVTVCAQKIAVKLVHRSKTSTTAARVRSLWNEMKIVRTFRNDPHPSIIPFHSFIITPSYALITMDYLPTLVPVEVAESKAREWFRSLLSGVEFLHKRGVVHNDIKPANILLSQQGVPVLVDFGFAEKYDLDSSTAFHSNLSYGTPEYLSPERARGLPHDTRKSDVWSLGVTFFEILMGRTPFEHSDGEQFTTKDDLERYWSRTLKGEWVGSWSMSPGIERLLQRMIVPNADLRCTASQAMEDPYWEPTEGLPGTHHRSASRSSAVDMASVLPKTRQNKPASRSPSPPGLLIKIPSKPTPVTARSTPRVKTQPKAVVGAKVPVKKRVPPALDLSPIPASPPATPHAISGKENASARLIAKPPSVATPVRHPLAVVTPRRKENISRSRLESESKSSVDSIKDKRKTHALGDLSNRTIGAGKTVTKNNKRHGSQEKDKGKDSVRERVREWEREKERLREIERLEALERERDEQIAEENERQERMERVLAEREREQRERAEVIPDSSVNDVYMDPVPIVPAPPPMLPVPVLVAPLSPEPRATPRTPARSSGSGLSALRHSIKKSIDKTVQFCKQSSTLVGSRLATSRGPSICMDEQQRESWEAEVMKHAGTVEPTTPAREDTTPDTNDDQAQLDRLTMWMRDVEKVVEDTRQSFTSSANLPVPPPALPIAPSRSASQNRNKLSSRMPRKILPANQIFADEMGVILPNPALTSSSTSTHRSPSTSTFATFSNNTTTVTSPNMSIPSIPEIRTPSRQRRATLAIHSPGKSRNLETCDFDLDTGSPSKRKEKSKSYGNLLQRHIAPISVLEAELAKPPPPPQPSPRLATMMDRNLFLARPLSPSIYSEQPQPSIREKSFDELTSSPLQVEPYPMRKPSSLDPVDSPTQRRLEGVYDRFLMATSGVKRVGKGYQSDNMNPTTKKRSKIAASIYQNHKATPTPTSSNYHIRASSALDLSTKPTKEENNTITLVRRAFKAFVPSKTASRRLSRIPA
ncbi:hypothetical protein AX16_008037 [Volvariella volvacea WC 439]|nr:hypothetical protein AX16_008037 [Volvariella volvacea WC 439]